MERQGRGGEEGWEERGGEERRKKTKGEINPEFNCFKNACEVTDASSGGSICVYVNASLVCQVT